MSVSRSGPRGRWALASVVALALAATGCSRGGGAGEYPTRTVQVVVPYPAGSGIDTTTRALVDIINADGGLEEQLQVVNKDGGGGSVGTTEVLNAKADGYTIGVLPDGPLTLVPQTEDVAYDPDEITVIRELLTSPIMFVVPEGSPYEDLDDLIAAAKANPGSISLGEGPLNYAVPADVVEQETGTEFNHIDFDGDQATTTALLGDNVDVGVMQLASALPQLESGKLRALALTSAEPVDLVPDVPTFTSEGIDLVWDAYNLVIAPSGLPDDVDEKLQDVFTEAVESEDFEAAAAKLGLIISNAAPDDALQHLEEKVEFSGPYLETSQ